MYNLCVEDNIYVIYILIYVIESTILFQICFLDFLYRNACSHVLTLGWVQAHTHASMCM